MIFKYFARYLKFNGEIIDMKHVSYVYDAIGNMGIHNYPKIVLTYKNGKSMECIQENTSKVLENAGFVWNRDFWYDSTDTLRLCPDSKKYAELSEFLQKKRIEYDNVRKFIEWRIDFIPSIKRTLKKFFIKFLSARV